MTILEITILLYLFVGFFLAGQAWEDTDEFHFIIRILITVFYIAVLPITLILGWLWELVKLIFNPIDSLFQISFYATFYIFKRKAWRKLDHKYLQQIYLLTQEKRNTNSLKDRIYRHAAEKMFEGNNFTPNKNYKKDDE